MLTVNADVATTQPAAWRTPDLHAPHEISPLAIGTNPRVLTAIGTPGLGADVLDNAGKRGAQLGREEARDVCGLAGECRGGCGGAEPRRFGTAGLDRPGTRCRPPVQHDGFEYPAAPQDVVVVL